MIYALIEIYMLIKFSRTLSFLKAILFSLIEHIGLSSSKINDFRASISILLKSNTLNAIICI